MKTWTITNPEVVSSHPTGSAPGIETRRHVPLRVARWASARPGVRPATAESDWRQAQELLHDYAAWIQACTGADVAAAQEGFARELTDLRAEYHGMQPGSQAPRGEFLVADDGFGICGVVGLRHHPDGSAELKRLYVRPAARGARWADHLVAEALGLARLSGATRMWLETLPGVMDAAIGLYRRHGFETIDAPPTVGVDGVIVMACDLSPCERSTAPNPG